MSTFPRPPRPCEEAQRTGTPDGNRRSRPRNHGDTGHHFDLLKRTNPGCVRILLHNVNGIGFISSDKSKATIKLEKLKKLLLQNNFSYAGITEVNKDWRKIPHNHSIWGATTNWAEHRRIQVSQNVHSIAEKEHLVGGTATIAFGDMVFRIYKQGQDFRNLGRWSFMTIQGKNNLLTTIITCYCPVLGTGALSAYSQHLLYMSSHREDIPDHIDCPRQLFGHDLTELVISLQSQDHQIVLMGDFNSEYSHLEDWMLNLGLVNTIKEKHDSEGPRTCLKSKDSPIDCIFSSPQIKIRSGGLLSFGRLDSDHRGLWIDIPDFLIYGYNPPPFINPAARRLKLEDPRIVSKYITCLTKMMHDNDLFNRMEKLHKATIYPLPPHLQKEYESIDKIITSLMDKAEHQCRKIKAGKHPWSPGFERARKQVEYWVRREKYIKGECKNARYLINLQNQLGIQFDPTLSLQDIQSEIKQAKNNRTRCYKDAESLSIEFRTQLAMAKEEAGEVKAATALRNMNRIEEQRRLFRRIRHMEGKIQSGNTTQVTITSPNGTKQEYTAQKDVESKIIENNETKRHQTEEGACQLILPEFTDLLGHFGEGPAIPEILNGTFTPPACSSEATLDFLEACTFAEGAENLKAQTPTIASRFKASRYLWSIRKEKTSTYNQHLGHYKAVMKDDYLSWFFFQRSEIPSISGYSPKRHRTCADLMILKKAMDFELSKNRAIRILDTEFNQLNKAVGYTATKHALQLDTFATEQFSRPGRSAIDQCISKRCAIDHHRSRRLCFAMTSCDLAGCYDRIVHTAAALALLRLGISHAKVETMFASIQRMVHKIRTAFGDSEATYGGEDFSLDWRAFPQGVLQGNASGPAIWAVLSSVIFDILRKKGFSVHFCGAISRELFLIVGYSYVDDCDLFQSGENPLEVLESMQALIRSWGSLVEVTGGALRPDKSWWYLIEYTWRRGKWTATDAHEDQQLVAPTPEGEEVALQRLRANEAAELLGVWMAPSGDNTKLVKVLKKHAVDWAGKIRLGRPSQKEAYTALKTTISAKLKYPLACSTLTQQECKSIMHPALKAALGKSGLASNISTKVRDGPIESGGAGILSLFHFQGTARIAALTEHVLRRTPTGKQILICIEDMTLDTGLYGLLWDMPFPKYSKWVDKQSWIYSICEYNHQHNITIQCPHPKINPSRVQDRSIMEYVSSFISNTSELRAINRVRQFHGIVHISDITSADGYFLNPEFLCSAEFDGRRNDYLWPTKHHVTSSDYTSWRRALEQLFPVNPLQLVNPLGTWILDEALQWTKHWDWFSSTSSDFLFRQVGEDSWRRHVKIEGTRRSYHTQFLLLATRPTQSLLRATVKESRNTWILLCTNNTSILRQNINIATTTTFDTITIQQPSIRWFHKYLESTPQTHILRQHLLEGTAIAVSDGSYFPDEDVGACAWIIATPDGAQWISGGGSTPQGDDSYRTELAGQVGIASCLEGIAALTTIENTPEIIISCDGISALKKTAIPPDCIRPKAPHIDLISILSSLWQSLPFQPIRKHVYGHQDATDRTLTVAESLNCRMDEKAKHIARRTISSQRQCTFHHSQLGLGTILIDNQRITSNVQRNLYHHITHTAFLDRLHSTTNVDNDTLSNTIHWKSFGQARKSCTLSQATFITKLLSNSLPTGIVMVARKQRLHPYCPICKTTDEDILHMLTCRHHQASTTRETLLQDLKLWMITSRTDPDITRFILAGLRSWFLDPFGDEPLHTSTDHTTFLALTEQLELGWFALLCGYLTHSLVTTQHRYFQSISSRRHGASWAKQLTQKLWNLSFSIWKSRNSCLHDTDTIHRLHGLTHLRRAIAAECALGQSDLPQPYAPFFYLPASSLLRKSTQYLKRWFATVRSGREQYQHIFTADEFTQNEILRAWIGLNPPD
jgi:hypothetical protein